MTPEQFRANAAGYLDSAATLINTVTNTLQVGAAMKGPGGKPMVEYPLAMLQELEEAKAKLLRVSEWMLSPHNAALEQSGGAHMAPRADG